MVERNMNQDKIWKDVPGYEGKYKISEDGDLYSFHSDRILKPTYAGTGYPYKRYTLKRRPQIREYAHRLVCLAFHGPAPAGMECRHLDGDSENNHYTNLCWGTHSENFQDTIKHGTYYNPKQGRIYAFNQQSASL